MQLRAKPIKSINVTVTATIKAFILATRPRTFPLALASIVCGTGLAFSQLASTAHIHSGTHRGISVHNWLVFGLTLWVALALQILSNLANDYGDGIKGTDNLRQQHSPTRMLATGQLPPKPFKRLIYLWAFFTFCSGVALISIGFNSLRDFLLFLAFGIIAIVAAMAYTMGKRPYGYRALGEVAVLIFFGWLGVLGSAYLQTQRLTPSHLIVATGCGGLAACVLYINNMRDINTDRQANKVTIAVLLGKQRMRKGYYLLLTFSLLCYFVYAVGNHPYSALWLLALPSICKHLATIQTSKGDSENTIIIGNQLKTIVMTTLMVNVLFVAGLALSHLLS